LHANGFCQGLPLSKLRLSSRSSPVRNRRCAGRLLVFAFRPNMMPLPELDEISEEIFYLRRVNRCSD
jgi:hypothetical protein